MAGDRNLANVVRAVKNYTGETVIGAYEPTSVSEELLRAFDIKRRIREEELTKICQEMLVSSS